MLFVLSCFQHETKAKSLRIFEYLMPFKLILLLLFEPDFITVHSYFVNYPKPRMLLKCVGLFCFPVFIFVFHKSLSFVGVREHPLCDRQGDRILPCECIHLLCHFILYQQISPRRILFSAKGIDIYTYHLHAHGHTQ